MKTVKYCLLFFLFVAAATSLNAQQKDNSFPKVQGYIGVVHPIVTLFSNETVYNFNGSYTVGFPTGINIIKTEHFGYSLEVVPFINSSNGTSKTSNVLFHPGIMFRYKHGFTWINRLAFETSGRYGITPIFNKVIIKSKNNTIAGAIPIPIRFGNNRKPSIGAGIQVAIVF